MESRQIYICEQPEIRAKTDGKDRFLDGYAAVFNSKTHIRDMGGEYDEIIEPTAFDDSLKDEGLDVVALYDHEGQPLGRTTSGTLKLSTDSRGLRYSVKLGNTQLANDVYDMVKRGDVNGSSFGFTIGKDGEKWDTKAGKYPLRTLTRCNLMDVSPVMSPAYKSTSVMARSKQMVSIPIDWQEQLAIYARKMEEHRKKNADIRENRFNK